MSDDPAQHSRAPGEHRRRRKGSRPHREPLNLRDYWELGGGILLLIVTVLTPWMWGTTEAWAVRLVNGGTLVAAVSILQRSFGHKGNSEGAKASGAERIVSAAFLIINLVLIAFCVVAYLNARATFSIEDRGFTYRENVIPWLPTSYDQKRTGQFLLNTAAFFAAFWGARAWFKRGWRGISNPESKPHNLRLKWFLWVMCVNGFTLAVQGIFQRLTGSSKLLWIRDSYWHVPDACFGPFSYRGNAADFLNLIWPLIFGLWYYLARKNAKPGKLISDGPEMLLLPMFFMTAAGTFISLSRGGSLTAGILLLALFAVVLTRSRSKFARFGVAASLILIVSLVIVISRGELSERFKSIFTDNLSGRTEIYANARQIASDFPIYGSGPGTFVSIYHMYRETPAQEWQGFVHDDWLETRVTFGWVGFSLVLVQFALLFAWAILGRKRWLSEILGYCLILSLAGCLLHAKGDFPFGTYAIVYTFVLVAALLTSLAAPRSPGSEAPRAVDA